MNNFNRHTNEWQNLPPDVQEKAIACMQTFFAEYPDVAEEVTTAIKTDPDTWWAPYHFYWGMGVRNMLRNQVEIDGTERIGNWDDYYIYAIEAGLGVR